MNTAPSRRRDRPRLPAAVRRRQILDATTRLIAERGFWGLSMQDVADECGLTVPGLLHHVGSKDKLLVAVLEHRDDQDHRSLAAELGLPLQETTEGVSPPALTEDTPPPALTEGAPLSALTEGAPPPVLTEGVSSPEPAGRASSPEFGGRVSWAEIGGRVSLPEICAALVRRNAAQPEIVRLFAVLEAESLAPDHPAHDYFRARQETTIAQFGELAKARTPEPEVLARQVMALMDGLQIQWLRDPGGIDLVAAWSAASETLFR